MFMLLITVLFMTTPIFGATTENLDYGAQYSTNQKQTGNVLMMAIQQDKPISLENIRILLRNGAAEHINDRHFDDKTHKSGKTALMFALENALVEIVQELLLWGALPELKSPCNDGGTASSLLFQAYCTHREEKIELLALWHERQKAGPSDIY